MVEHKTDSGHTVGKEFPTQMELTENTTKLIRQINSSDLNPEEKKQAIRNLKGITRAEMKAIIETTGPTLAESVREFINSSKD